MWSLLLVAAALASDVVELTDQNFDQTIKDNKIVFVEFYAPWCGHSKALDPEFEKAATQLKKDGTEAVLAKVDATIEETLANDHKVEGFPTLKLYKKDYDTVEYQGERIAKDMISYVERKAGPPAVQVNSEADIAAFKDKFKISVIGYFKDFSGDEWEAYKTLADQDDHPARGWCATTIKGENSGERATVFTTFDEKEFKFTGGLSDLGKFVNQFGLPLLSDWDTGDQEAIFDEKRTEGQLFAFFTGKASDEQRAALREAAKAYRGRVPFTAVDVKSDEAKDLVEFMGLDFEGLDLDNKSEEYFPAIRMMTNDNRKFKLDKYDLGADFTKFVDGVLDGSTPAWWKSEDAPKENKGPAHILTGESFNATIHDDAQDVLVFFYAPWCGHCKELQPHYEEVGKAAKKVKSLTIAKMDATANEVQGVEIEGFPTLKYYQAGKTREYASALEYDGERTHVAIKAWVKENAGVKFDWPGVAGAKEQKEGLALIKKWMAAVKEKDDAPDDWRLKLGQGIRKLVQDLEDYTGTEVLKKFDEAKKKAADEAKAKADEKKKEEL